MINCSSEYMIDTQRLIRSMRIILQEEDFDALKHATNFADFKLELYETDYQQVLLNE